MTDPLTKKEIFALQTFAPRPKPILTWDDMSRIVPKLVAAELVVSEYDGSVFRYVLTDAGKTALNKDTTDD